MPVNFAQNSQFSDQVRAWAEKAKGKEREALQAIVLALVSRLKELTPVKSGLLRASWTVVKEGDVIPLAGQTGIVEVAISSLQVGDSFWILNPVVYANRINFGFQGPDARGRVFHQSGVHMVEQTIAESPVLAQQAIERISNG